MTSVIFVHGTGVRREAYDAAMALVSAGLSDRPGVAVVECYWGHLGSNLRDARSIPNYDSARNLTADAIAISDEEYAAALWGVLRVDPLYELRALGLRRQTTAERPVGQVAPGAELARLGQQFPIGPQLQALLDRGGIGQGFIDTRAAVTSSAAYKAALDAAPAALADDRAAIARALIAEALARAAAEGRRAAASYDSRLREEIERALVEALGGKERSIGGWVRKQLGGMVMRLGLGAVSHLATPYVTRKRGAVTDAAYPAAGDILLYQARGDTIGDYIRQRILQTPAPRLVLAHSLGGIACVDLLVKEPAGVDQLVTVGSQAPFLYEIDALRSLRYRDPVPATFPRWLNVYDLRDFLSYVGSGVFDGRVDDLEVDNGEAFPASHSAYWSNPQVWNGIKAVLP
jgi:hypothetical protein